MKIIIFRHADKQTKQGESFLVDNNRCLSSEGIKQTKVLARHLKTEYALQDIETVHSSLYGRSIQSAEIAREVIGAKEIRIHEELCEMEYHLLSDWDISFKKRDEICNYHIENPDVTRDKGISLTQAISNYLTRVSEIALMTDTEYAVITSHGYMMDHLYYTLTDQMNIDPQIKINKGVFHMYDYMILELVPGGLVFSKMVEFKSLNLEY